MLSYVPCRNLRHSWDVTPLSEVPEEVSRSIPRWGRSIVLQCMRCTMVRVDTFDYFDRLGARRYVQPVGYDLGVDGRHETSQLRAALLERMFDQGSMIVGTEPDRYGKRPPGARKGSHRPRGDKAKVAEP